MVASIVENLTIFLKCSMFLCEKKVIKNHLKMSQKIICPINQLILFI